MMISAEDQYRSIAEARYQASLDPVDHLCFECSHCVVADSSILSENLEDAIEDGIGYCKYLDVFVSDHDTSFYWECEQ